MNAIYRTATAIALVFGAAEAQSPAQHHGSPHSGPPPIGQPAPQIGGPNRHEFPGMMPNRLGMTPNGEIETVGPNRRDFGNDQFRARPDSDRLHGNFATGRSIDASPPLPTTPYRRWTAGQRLPPSGYGHDVQITRFGLYKLATPPPNTVWVRSGPDALLVDRGSGEIIRARYGLFN